MKRALLFDLDDTLIREEPAAVEAFEATAWIAAKDYVDLDVPGLAEAARNCARELWSRATTYAYCRAIGMSSWEGLWCRFEGNHPEVRTLRAWAPTYRREAWRLALLAQDIDDATLAQQLSDRFVIERRARQHVFSDVGETLSWARQYYLVAIVTNGASCLQREKIEAGRLAKFFHTIVISADVGVGKPQPAIFEHALHKLRARNKHAVMIGDSLARDVDGGLAAGLRSIWVNRTGVSGTRLPAGAVELRTLSGLMLALKEL